MCSTITSAAAAETTKKLIAAVWARNQWQVLARLDLLDRTAACIADATVEKCECEEAAITAHKLAGSLGMFGYHQGTGLARLLEEQFESETPNASTLVELTTRLRLMLFPGNHANHAPE